MTSFEELPPGESGLLSARPGPDLGAAGYVDREYVARGTATSYAGEQTPDGRWSLEGRDEAGFATRVAVRRPRSPGSFSGTVVVEWLNVSSGSDAAPDWTYLAEEIVRRGHAWVGVSAQHLGVEGGDAVVGVAGIAPSGIRSRQRYAALAHPGDAYSYSIYAGIATSLDSTEGGGPLADLVVDTRLAVGESQSAFALTTFVNGVHPLVPVFDGFLIHSRGGAAMPLGEPGAAVDPRQYRGSTPMPVRDDLDVPVLMVETETDLVGLLNYLPARQPDSAHVRLWEVAGTAHADRYVDRRARGAAGLPAAGQPWPAGLRRPGRPALAGRLGARRGPGAPGPATRGGRIDGSCWTRPATPREASAPRRWTRRSSCSAATPTRTPPTSASSSAARCRCRPRRCARRYADRAAYLAAYARAADAAIEAGFVLPEDRRRAARRGAAGAGGRGPRLTRQCNIRRAGVVAEWPGQVVSGAVPVLR